MASHPTIQNLYEKILLSVLTEQLNYYPEIDKEISNELYERWREKLRPTKKQKVEESFSIQQPTLPKPKKRTPKKTTKTKQTPEISISQKTPQFQPSGPSPLQLIHLHAPETFTDFGLSKTNNPGPYFCEKNIMAQNINHRFNPLNFCHHNGTPVPAMNPPIPSEKSKDFNNNNNTFDEEEDLLPIFPQFDGYDSLVLKESSKNKKKSNEEIEISKTIKLNESELIQNQNINPRNENIKLNESELIQNQNINPRNENINPKNENEIIQNQNINPRNENIILSENDLIENLLKENQNLELNLNENRNLSSDSEEDENFETENQIVCLYSKLTKWRKSDRKCEMKYGVITTSGADYFFSSGTAKLIWINENKN